MAISRFKHPMGAVKAVAVVACLAIAGTAHAESEALTPTMQACLSENSLEAGLAMVFAQTRAEMHVGEDVGKAKLAAWIDAYRLKCDLRPGEVSAALEYLIAKEKRQQQVIQNPSFTRVDPALYGGFPDAADPAEVRKHRERSAAIRRPATAGPREIPLCVGNCR
jgi:hypothetical protein